MSRLLSDRVGLRVHVEPVDQSIPVQDGVIVKRKRLRWLGPRRRMPYIRLDDGRILAGFECWWCAAIPDPVGRWSIHGWEPKRRDRPARLPPETARAINAAFVELAEATW